MDKETVQSMLDSLTEMTSEMRVCQDRIRELGQQRRVVVRALTADRVPYKRIAASMGVTDQAIYADLRKHKNEVWGGNTAHQIVAEEAL